MDYYRKALIHLNSARAALVASGDSALVAIIAQTIGAVEKKVEQIPE